MKLVVNGALDDVAAALSNEAPRFAPPRVGGRPSVHIANTLYLASVIKPGTLVEIG